MTGARAGKLGCAGIGLLLASIIALELRLGPSIEATPVDATPTVVPTRTTSATNTSERGTWVQTALERPLFSQTRRPPGSQPVAAADGPQGLPRLTGVMVGPFGRRAVFAGPEGGKPLVVETGDSVGEFRVRSIDAEGVTLTGPEGERHLRPSFAEGDNVPTAAPTQPGRSRR